MNLSGFQITFSDGDKVSFAPRDTSQPALMEYKNFLLKIEDAEFRFETFRNNEHKLTTSDIVSVEKMEFEAGDALGRTSVLGDVGIRKTCGGGCCVTNACCNCGSGWICDLR